MSIPAVVASSRWRLSSGFEQERVGPGGVGHVEHGPVDAAVLDRGVEDRGDQQPALSDAFKQLVPPLAVAGARDQQRRQDVGRVEVDRRAGATDLLGGDRGLLKPKFRAAEVHIDQEAGDALIAELVVDRLVLPRLGVHHATDALQPYVLGEKAGDRVSEQLLRLRQSKVHAGLLRVVRRARRRGL